jgi:hypothetical protein
MSEYRRLTTAWSPGWLRSATLFDGGDHLLQVTSLRVQHEYQRFPYAEIRAITVTETPLWTPGRVVRLLAFLILFLLAMLPSLLALRVALAVVPGTLLLLQLWSLLQGRRCEARLISLSGEWPLRGVGTMRAVAEAVPQIVAKVQAAQAGLAQPAVMPALAPGKVETPYRHPRELGWTVAATLILSALLIVVYTLRPDARTEIWNVAMFLVPGALTMAIAWWRMLQRFQTVAAAVVAATVVDLLLFCFFLLLEWRRPTFSLTLAQITLAAQQWQAVAVAAAIGWRVVAAAAVGWVAQQGGEEKE